MAETKPRSVLVTGASGGIGRACAVALARAGFAIAAHASHPSAALDETVRLVQEAGGSVRTLAFDVRDAAAARAAVESDMAANGAYWGVLSNAGIARDAAFPALEAKDWHDVIDVSLNGFFNVVQPCIMPMVRARRGGRIVAMSSVSGIAGNRGQANYSAAKAGLVGAIKSMAVELARRNITCNAVAPGLIDTAMLDMQPEAMEAAMAAIPMRRMGRPEEVASLVAFLMSDAAGYITRQVISINGGML